jgi:mRNA interferase RelE/StbE
MTIEITRKFQKQVEACMDSNIRIHVGMIIREVSTAFTLSEIRNLKKLKGSKNCFRIKLGSYRIGLTIRNNVVIFAAFDHRSDIYKYFP